VERHARRDAVDLRRPRRLPLGQVGALPGPAGVSAGGAGGPETDLSVADELIAGWAAALGQCFQVEQLSRAAMLPVPVVAGALESLERHGLVRRVRREVYEVLAGAAAEMAPTTSSRRR
jgi:hypothetical protein